MRLRILLLAALGLGLAPGAAAGWSFLDRAYGTTELGLSPRARALGGAGAALPAGGWSLVENPALLAAAPGRRAHVAASFARASENRYVPLFDTFDSYVDETAIAVNDHGYAAADAALAWGDVRGSGVALAAGVFGRADARYDYADERRSVTTDRIVSTRTIETRGLLRSAALGIAAPAWRGRAFTTGVGAAFHRWFGTLDDRDALAPYLAPGDAVVTRERRRLEGWSLAVGATATAGDRVRAGVCYETSPRLDDAFTRWRDGAIVEGPDAGGTLRLPPRVQAGLSVRPRGAPRSTAAMDLVFVPWSKAHDPRRAGGPLHDVWEARFGLEHVFHDDVPARVGFRYASSYGMVEADRAVFTFGVGWRAARAHFDVAGEVGKRNSRQAPLWTRPDPGPAVGLGSDRVEDTLVRLTAGAEWAF